MIIASFTSMLRISVKDCDHRSQPDMWGNNDRKHRIKPLNKYQAPGQSVMSMNAGNFPVTRDIQSDHQCLPTTGTVCMAGQYPTVHCMPSNSFSQDFTPSHVPWQYANQMDALFSNP